MAASNLKNSSFLKNQRLTNQQPVVKSWKTLLLGSLIVGILALSIHAVMLQILNVPSPTGFPRPGWPAFINKVPVVLGTIWLTTLGWPRLQQFAVATRCLIVVVLVAMVNESLFRAFLMNGWVTTAWRYNYVAYLPAFLTVVFYGSCAVLLVSYTTSLRTRVVAGVGVAAVLTFAVSPALKATIDGLLQRIAYLNHAPRFGFPYGWQVVVPAYLTFAEPVVAGLGIAWLIWPQLPAKPSRRLLLFVGLLLLVKGQVLAPFINMVYDQHGPLTGLLAELQFTLEALVLAIGLGLVWSFAIGYTQPKPYQS